MKYRAQTPSCCLYYYTETTILGLSLPENEMCIVYTKPIKQTMGSFFLSAFSTENVIL